MDNQDDELDDPECCPVEDLVAVVLPLPLDFLVVRVIASSPEVVTSLHSLVLSIIVKRD